MQQIKKYSEIVIDSIKEKEVENVQSFSYLVPPIKKEPLTYSQKREARALAVLEHMTLVQAYEAFSLRTADTRLVQKNDKLQSILGLLDAELNAIFEVLSSTDKNKTEHDALKEDEYLRYFLENV